MDRIPLHVDDVDQTMQLLRLLAANIIHFRSIMAEQQASNSSHSSDSSFCSGIESGTSIGPDISPDISTSTSSPEAQPCIAHLLIAPDHESAIVGAYANRLAVEMMANETRVLSLEENRSAIATYSCDFSDSTSSSTSSSVFSTATDLDEEEELDVAHTATTPAGLLAVTEGSFASTDNDTEIVYVDLDAILASIADDSEKKEAGA